MLPEFAELEREVRDSKALYERLAGELQRKRATCQHVWGETKYDPIVIPGYHIAGDPPGTMGVDRQLPMDVPTQRTDRWTRTCEKCGTTQETKQTRDQVAKIPVF